MAVVREVPVLLRPGGLFCPGCGHNIFMRLICEVIEEVGYENKSIMNFAVGCTCNHHYTYKGEKYQAPHGRPAAVATGMKRTNPDLLVLTYQGDGDAYTIGIAESLNAAYRNENISVFVVNNSVFGMTGGQMGWTTLPGQKTTTSPDGRDPGLTGEAFRFPELVATQFSPAYVARGSVHSLPAINKTKGYIKNAIEAQLNGEGYSMVEVLSQCPTNWRLSTADSIKWLEEKMIPVFPLGEFKKRGES